MSSTTVDRTEQTDPITGTDPGSSADRAAAGHPVASPPGPPIAQVGEPGRARFGRLRDRLTARPLVIGAVVALLATGAAFAGGFALGHAQGSAADIVSGELSPAGAGRGGPPEMGAVPPGGAGSDGGTGDGTTDPGVSDGGSGA